MKKTKNIIKLIVCLINILLSIFLIINLNGLNMLPNKYLILILIIFIILNILSIVLMYLKKKWINVIGFVFSLIIIIISIIGINISNDVTGFINNTFGNETVEIVEYNVVVLKENNYNDIKDLENKKIGIYNTNYDLDDKVNTKLDEFVKAEKIQYSNFTEIKNDLYSKSVDGILVSSSTYELLCEASDTFEDKTKIIKVFFVELEKEIKEEQTKVNIYDPINIYISGIDTNGSLSKVSRSDVNIIMTINPNTNEILLTTIPRDTYVQLSGTTGLKDKLTHAGVYGIDMSKRTIEEFLSIKIDYYVRVNFDSVVAIVDEIGGIDLNNDIAFTQAGRYFAVGMIHLNGYDALTYARERKLMPEGDVTRGRHQQKVIEAIINKINNNRELLLNYENIMNKLSMFFQTNMGSDVFQFYVKNQLDKMPNWNINSISVDCTGSNGETYSMPGWNLYIAIPNEESISKTSRYINGIINGKKFIELS